MTTSATKTRKTKDQRRGRPLGGGRRAKTQSDDPVLRAVEQMVEAPDFPWARVGDGMLRHEIFYPDFPWPSHNEGNLLREIFGVVRSGVRGLPYRLAIEGEKARISAPHVLGLAWDFIDGKITKAEFWAELGRVSSFIRAIVADIELEQSERLGLDDELLQFHVWREAEADRKRVCPALPKAELLRLLAALCKRDWTRTNQWVRVESLRRWLAMSPEAIRQAAGSGRWATDIALESPESRRSGARRGGKPAFVLGPRAVAKVLRAYAANGGELGPEAKDTAATLDRIGRNCRAEAQKPPFRI